MGMSPSDNHDRLRRRARWLTRWWRAHRWLIAAVLWVIAIVLGYYGFARYQAAASTPATPLDLAYLTMQLLAMNSGALPGQIPVSLQIARFLIPLLAGYTIILTIFAIFWRQLEELRLRFVRDHVVICGIDIKGSLLAEGFMAREASLVLIDIRADNPALERFRGDQVFCLIGNATDPDLLRRARVERATHLIAVCGDDGVNAAIAVAAEEANGHRRRGTLTCSIHIFDGRLSELVQDHVFLANRSGFHLEIFNIYQRGARLMWQTYPPPVTTGRAPRVLLIGLGQMGESLIVQATYWWRDRQPRLENLLEVTVVDVDTETRLAALLVRHQPLTQVCQLTSIEMDPKSPGFETDIFLTRLQLFDIAYVCLEDTAASIQCGLQLEQRLGAMPIIVRTETDSGLARLLSERRDPANKLANLHAFAVLPNTCTPALIQGGSLEILARAIHEEYVQTQLERGETADGNPNMVAWDWLPSEAQESNRQQAAHISVKLHAVGYRLQALQRWEAATYTFSEEEVEQMARMEHNRYLEERRIQGWQFGLVRDAKEKRNPALTSWEGLPERFREINRDFVRGMPSFLAKVGYQVVKAGQRNGSGS